MERIMVAPRFSRDGKGVVSRPVQILLEEYALRGDLTLPHDARGIVVFAHGSGSSRVSPRNRIVARSLERHSLGTMLLDLLTEEEAMRDEITREFRFDIELLADRLVVASEWLKSEDGLAPLPVGYFGASTGAAAALKAAARLPGTVKAIVSRGGRPDLARADLERVFAPTRLIVGQLDPEVLELNERALRLIPGPKDTVIVHGASHLFEEPGALEFVAELAEAWFLRFLVAP
jgi:pimeloyl-ACP methyl ester carboxylesterase